MVSHSHYRLSTEDYCILKRLTECLAARADCLEVVRAISVVLAQILSRAVEVCDE